jgi:O-antigen/teichoic acid export membrane protein
MSTIARSVRGTLVGSLTFIVQALQSVVVVPLMLQGWGATQYALWLACQAGMTMVLTFEAGHQTYVGNELAKQLPVDVRATREVLGSALRMTCVLATLEIGFAALIWRGGLSHRVFGLRPEESDAAAMGGALFSLVVSWLLAGAWGGIFARLYPPAGKFVRGAVWSLISRVMISVTAAVAALRGASIFETALWVSASTFLFSAATLVDASFAFRALRPFTQLGTLRHGFQNFARSLTLTGSIFIAQLQVSGLVLFLTSSLGAAGIAPFVTLRTLANAIVQAATLVFSPTVAEIVRFHVRSEYDKLRTALLGLSIITTAVAAWGAFALALLGGPLYEIWTRHKIGFDRPLFHVIAASVLWRIAGAALVNHLNAMNRLRWIAIWSSAQTATLFALAIPGCRWFGLQGVAFALLASEVLGSFIIPVIWLERELPIEARKPFRRDQALCALTPLIGSLSLLAANAMAAGAELVTFACGTAAIALALLVQLRRIPSETLRLIVLHASRALRRTAES